MKNLTICVVENTPEHHKLYTLFMRQKYGDVASIIPDADNPCHTWKDATKLIKSVPKTQELILILDLQLDAQGDAAKGIQEADLYRLERPDVVIIALTGWAAQAKQHHRSDSIFNAIIDKQDPEVKDTEKLREILYEKIEEGRNLATKQIAPKKIEFYCVDSLPMRLAEAAITMDGLKELVEREAKEWSSIRVKALTSGNSGSYLLQILGVKENQPASLVLKVSSKKSVLDDEATVVKQYGAIFNQFGSRLATASDVVQLNHKEIYYCRQVSVFGETLYDLIKKKKPMVVSKAFDSLLHLLTKQYHDSLLSQKDQLEASKLTADTSIKKCFGFRPDQPYRIYDSCSRLQPAAEILSTRKEWPKGVPEPTIIFERINKITKDWESILAQMKVPFWVIQHGDLHAGNVMVSGGQLTLIDLARLKAWPVGYDISRLATHARIHLPGQEDDRDFVEHDLKNWVNDRFASGEKVVPPGGSVWSKKADEAFFKFVNKHAANQTEDFFRLYRFCSLSDLLRILTYNTLSHFKRIWVAIAIWQLSEDLKLYPVKSAKIKKKHK